VVLKYNNRAVATLVAMLLVCSGSVGRALANDGVWDPIDDEKLAVYLLALGGTLILAPVNLVDITNDGPSAVKGIMGMGFGGLGIYAGGLAFSKGGDGFGVFLIGLGVASAVLGAVATKMALNRPPAGAEVRPEAIVRSGRLQVGLSATVRF